jgi:uncharacterized protein (UPF0371 family)
VTRPAGFDNCLYLDAQAASIRERLETADKLFLEFGGKLLYDFHAARVLPGYDPNIKMRLLHELRDQAEIILCIHAGHIERRKMRADFGITYDADAMKLVDDLHDHGLEVTAVIITCHEGRPAAEQFRRKLERRGLRVYAHAPIPGYPDDLTHIVSPNGYGALPLPPTTRPLVVVTAPGPGSGKLATCLAMLYHEHQAGRRAAYAKFETFPVWDLLPGHPLNLAYEAATADLGDTVQTDPFHLEATGRQATSYSREINAFPLLRTLLQRLGAAAPCRSPTDLGVNRIRAGITNEALIREASCQEIIRRHFRYACEYALGLTDSTTLERLDALMRRLDLQPDSRRVVAPARQAALDGAARQKGNLGVYCGAALELADGTLITGKNSPLMHAASSVVLNAIKHLAGIPDNIHLLPPAVTRSIGALKHDILGRKTESLSLNETLIALSISATLNPSAQAALECLKQLAGTEFHATHIPTPGDETGLKRLGIHVTCDPHFPSRNLLES